MPFAGISLRWTHRTELILMMLGCMELFIYLVRPICFDLLQFHTTPTYLIQL